MSTGRDRAIRKAYQRFCAEIADAKGVPAESAEALRLAFFYAAGTFQSALGGETSCLQVLNDEIAASIAANQPSEAAR